MSWRFTLIKMVLGMLALPAASALLLAGPPPAQAATLTYPSDGQVVTLDQHGNFTFHWAMAPGEMSAEVDEGDQPTALTSSFCPDSNLPTDPTATECRMNFQTAGTHYAAVSASTDDGSSSQSPPIRFVVRVMLGWGCPDQSGCGLAGWHETRSNILPPNSGVGGYAWDNVPDSTATATLVVRHGRRVVKRLHHTVSSDNSAEGLFILNLMFFHIRGVRAGTPLQATLTVSAAGRTLSKNLRLVAP